MTGSDVVLFAKVIDVSQPSVSHPPAVLRDAGLSLCARRVVTRPTPSTRASSPCAVASGWFGVRLARQAPKLSNKPCSRRGHFGRMPGHGAFLSTVLAFIMPVVDLSLTEITILTRYFFNTRLYSLSIRRWLTWQRYSPHLCPKRRYRLRARR